MSRIIGINGSPRTKNNCATLLDYALEGAREAGAETIRHDLVRLDKYFGCISCFACKQIGGKSFGKCAVVDSLREILQQVLSSDGLVLSIPIYFGDVPGMVRSLLERLWFPGYTYSLDGTIAYDRRVPSLLIYTMNSPDESYYDALFAEQQGTFKMIVGPSRTYAVTETLQFDDYDRYASEVFDGAARLKRHYEVFPEECQRARELGVELATTGWSGQEPVAE